MSRSSLKAIQSAAGAAGGDPVYVDDVFATRTYNGNGGSKSIDNGIKLGNSLIGGTATLFNWNDKMELSSGYQTESGVNSYTISFYIRCITGVSSQMRFIGIDAYSFCYMENDRFLITINRHDGNGNAAALYYTCTGLSDGRWHHILFSVHSNGSESCYFDDSAASLWAGDVYSSSNMAGVGSGASYGVDIGGLATNSPTGTARFEGSLAHVYIKGGEYLDLSQSSNRRIFTNSDLTPVATSNLAARNPQIYLPLGDNRTTNLGTMNNFTETGTPKPCTGVDEVGTGEGGLVWVKARDSTSGGATSHALIDTERGADKWLSTDGVSEQATNANLVTAFNSDGFTVGTGGPYWTNDNLYKYVSWTFRKQRGFFDVVTWDGNGTAGRAISHNLGSVPGMIIVKSYDHPSGVGNTDWLIYHRQLNGGTNPEQYGLKLNSTGTEGAQSWWNNTAPTSTAFTVNASQDINGSGGKYVAYLFAHDDQNFGADSDESVIKCGHYEGDGGTQEITLGWEPQWVLIKNIDDSSNNWLLMDVMRAAPVEGDTAILEANTSDAEAVGSNPTKWYPTSTGFKVKQGGNGANDPNENNETYIYVAIRRPHKSADLVGLYKVFDQDYGTERATNVDPVALTNFPVDMVIERQYNTSAINQVFSRLTNKKYLQSNASNAEATSGLTRWWDYSDGTQSSFTSPDNYINYSWRRAVGFCDVVTYTGTGSTRTVTHNLGAVPEMMWVKNRSSAYSWSVYHSGMGATKYATLNSNANPVTNAEAWNDTAPTSTVFTVKDDGRVNLSGSDHIAYLFASVDGISKVGTFTRTSGDTTNVDCGFSNGTRFLIFKRFEGGTGNWTVYDSVRGIVAGNDPYFFLNDTSAPVTNTDYIDPLDAGFTVNSGIATGTFLFYAIAK